MERQEDGSIERMGYATKVDTYIKQFSGMNLDKLLQNLRILEERVKLPDMQGESEDVRDARFTFDAQIEAVKYLLRHKEDIAA